MADKLNITCSRGQIHTSVDGGIWTITCDPGTDMTVTMSSDDGDSGSGGSDGGSGGSDGGSGGADGGSGGADGGN